MRDSCVYIPSVHRVLVVVFFIAITAPFACATTLTPGQLTDLMIENQGDNAEFIGVVFGPDASSPLAFSSNVNPAGTLFSYSLTPRIYRGKSMTLAGTGSFNTATNVLELASSGSLGSFSWTTAGTAGVMFSGNDLNVSTNLNFLNGGVQKSADVHAEGFVRSDGTTGGFGFDTDENGDQIPGSTRIFMDSRQIGTGNLAYNSSTPGLGFMINTAGLSGSAGGPGAFTTTIAPVPEPSTMLLIGSGVAGLAVVSIGKRKGALPC